MNPKHQRGIKGPSLALRTLIGVGLFGWGPIVWLAFHAGISPAGTFVIGGISEWGQLLRPLTTGVILLGLSGVAMVAVSVVGLATAWQELWEPRRAWWVFALAWLLCSSIALVFSAHPVEPPSHRLTALLASVGIDSTPGMYVTPREGHLYISLLSIVAALGVARIGHFQIPGCERDRQAEADSTPLAKPWRAPAAGIVTALLLGHGVWIVADRIERAGNDPELRTAVAAARVVDALLDQGGRAVVLAKPIPPEAINDYLERASKAGGPEGERQAREILTTIETGPPAYQRMLVHSRYDRARLLDIDDLGDKDGDAGETLSARDIRYCVIFGDFVPRTSAERTAAAVAEDGSLVATIGVGARVYAISHGTR